MDKCANKLSTVDLELYFLANFSSVNDMAVALSKSPNEWETLPAMNRMKIARPFMRTAANFFFLYRFIKARRPLGGDIKMLRSDVPLRATDCLYC